ncbi:flagellar biosynthesis protein FlgM [Zhengella mangrovi]|uniref:Flagellar biosynthesis protein FlgM n=1 Tax=Zhengella mangrovi TaxID=1982044 RepID=A0A2G1QHE9_9HYPH|nr:neutral zinc metallopeptidase [Zhengella mangrovi]PHP64874.1 flagellar biosynthesis protein FlgM [Zhengella mangrovi]
MRWKGRRQSDNVEDLRGQSGGYNRGIERGGGRIRIPMGGRGGMGGARGGGLSGIVMLVILFFVLKACGIDPLQILAGGGLDQVTTPQTQTSGRANAPAQDETTQFMRTVLAETEDVWNGIFQAEGLNYTEPTMVLFSGQVRSACGFASSASGPFYCPGDRKLYLDTSFFDQLARQFKASGDFAQAYVVAHEVGHHVQNLIGVLPKFNKMRQSMSEVEANHMSVRVELQADCFAGIWAHYTAQKGLLEKGDIEEALNAAHQIGDDTLQKRSQGYVVPDSFNHGTSQQRATWFATGLKSGKLSACDTFNNPI